MAKIELIGVVGAGQMGRGIAQVAALSGFRVLLQDIDAASLGRAVQSIRQRIERGGKKGAWTDAEGQAALARISTVGEPAELADCHFVIESATENRSVKRDIFCRLDQALAPSAILVSNTSSISITEIAAATSRPQRVAGMHFMNPVPVMKLVEGIRGLKTSEATFDAVEEVAGQMGKTFIAVQDTAGFAINRILMPMINEGIFALHEGIASASDIDTGMKLGANWPMGPLELADFIGLDTCLAILEVLHQGLGEDKYRPCPLLRKYVAAGKFGRKSGEGFYVHR